MTFTLVVRSCSRRQSTKAFKAALDAEYAGKGAAGTMDRLDVVLTS